MRVLILTASPIRDDIVDSLIQEELQKGGHEVWVKPCLREGRQAVLDIHPDTVIMPPIRNPYSRDMAETIKGFGIGLVSRHTEPSCDWQDFKKMEPWRQQEIFGQYPYLVDVELVWSKDEAEILATRKTAFPVYAIGATTIDAYKRPDVIERHRNRGAFCQAHGFDESKKILLICSPWGMIDTHPDLHTEELDFIRKDADGLQRHLGMIRHLASSEALINSWNILVSIHPGVDQDPYKDLCKELKINLDTESRSFDLNIHVDAMIHAGSTMAVSAHLLNIPAYQFGDSNAKGSNSWWSDPESAISKISPYFKEPQELLEALLAYAPGTNASTQALAALEQGRFGCMDGQSTIRAAGIIGKIQGKFKLCWPKSTRDYSQLTILREPKRIYTGMVCGICGEPFGIVNESYLNMVRTHVLTKLKDYLKEELPSELFDDMWRPIHSHTCPHCAARFFIKEA